MEEEERPTKKAKLLNEDQENSQQDINGVSQDVPAAPEPATFTKNDQTQSEEHEAAQPMSKNAMKRLMRRKRHEETREQFKAMKREKKTARKQRRREEAALIAAETGQPPEKKIPNHEKKHYKVPLTVIIDCGFDDKMMEKEITSLGSQLTRCYSDNRAATYQTQLMITSFGGMLEKRFDGPMRQHHKAWTGVEFVEGDLVSSEATESTAKWNERCTVIRKQLADTNECDYGALKLAEADVPVEQEIIYLTSDSPHTLTSLSPHTSYVIGGLVDKNRYKGLCYQKAAGLKLKTARLPIGDFMEMSSRKVLTVNHVYEIMLAWIEHGDWGKAFVTIMPKRKGGVLKGEAQDSGQEQDGDTADGVTQPGDSETTDNVGEQVVSANLTADEYVDA